jgi:Fe-S oxidoreductase
VREAAFRAGVAPEAARSWAARIARLGNPHAADLPERLAALVPAGRLAPDGSAGPVLFPGCTTVRHAPRAVADALALLDRSALPGEAPVRVAARGAGCCGLPLLLAGDAAGFRDLATRVHGALRGAGRVISLDPGCVHAFETLYAGIGLQDLAGKARTLVESLFERERLARLETAVVRRLPTPPAYHDPCYLGRYRGVYDAPRALLAAATEGRAPPLELTTSREHAFCAGTGGIYGKVFPHGARRVLARRLGEVEGRGRLATACPSCVRGLEKNVDARIAPVDVTTVLAWAVGARDDGVNRERSC